MRRDATRPHEEAEEENYFTSLSDLMVGMLFIFIILIMAFALSYRVAQHEKETQTSELVKTKETLEVRQSELEKLKAETQAQAHEFRRVTDTLTDNDQLRRQMLRELTFRLKAEGVEVVLDEDNGVLRLPEEMLFDLGQAELRPEGKQKVQRLGEVMATILHQFEERGRAPRLEAILIEGHTDDTPVKGRERDGNWELSAQRAVNTYIEIVQSNPGLDAERNVEGQALLGVSAYADRRPVSTGTSEAAKHENRRIALRFLMTAPSELEVQQSTEAMQRSPSAFAP
jgi:chemotaxis protein MotB